jgi:hypothetical protein
MLRKTQGHECPWESAGSAKEVSGFTPPQGKIDARHIADVLTDLTSVVQVAPTLLDRENGAIGSDMPVTFVDVVSIVADEIGSIREALPFNLLNLITDWILTRVYSLVSRALAEMSDIVLERDVIPFPTAVVTFHRSPAFLGFVALPTLNLPKEAHEWEESML